jgi:2-C-methyl-D-erythritol 4-phosphate cytidylyltransferase
VTVSKASQAAVIVACGGIGARFTDSPSDSGSGDVDAAAFDQGLSQPKQFFPVAGKMVLAHTLTGLETHPRIGPVALVLPAQFLHKGEALVQGRLPGHETTRFSKTGIIVAGGSSRQESVSNGLSALADTGWEGPVLVHDGVRPCTPREVFDRVIDGVFSRGNAVAAVPIRDTIKRAEGEVVRETLDRRNLWQIQTPQGFWIRELMEAYEEGRRRGLQVTDDAALMEALGRRVFLVDGHPANIKLTCPDDVIMLEAILSIIRE